MSLGVYRPKPQAAAYLEFSEGHKLDNISRGNFTGGRMQQPVIAVKELHCTEVGPTHAHYDDRHGKTRGCNDRGTCLIHVCDHAICDDEQHKVLLQTDRGKRYQNILISFSTFSNMVYRIYIDLSL